MVDGGNFCLRQPNAMRGSGQYLLRPCFFPQNDRDNPPDSTRHNSDDPPNRLPEIRDHHPARYPSKGDQEQRNNRALRGFVVTGQGR